MLWHTSNEAQRSMPRVEVAMSYTWRSSDREAKHAGGRWHR